MNTDYHGPGWLRAHHLPRGDDDRVTRGPDGPVEGGGGRCWDDACLLTWLPVHIASTSCRVVAPAGKLRGVPPYSTVKPSQDGSLHCLPSGKALRRSATRQNFVHAIHVIGVNKVTVHYISNPIFKRRDVGIYFKFDLPFPAHAMIGE